MRDGVVRAHTLPTVSEALIARVGDDRPALLFEDEVVSWASLLEQASARARLALELRRDGPFHIAVLLENVPEYVYWIAAAALAGATVVGVNATRRGSELAGDITHTDCQLMVTDSGQARLLDGLDTGVEADRVLLADDPSYLGRVDLRRSLGVPAVEVGPGDLFLLLFTSGSTGAPKAVVCTQGRFARISSTTPAMFGITPGTVTYESMPLFHGNALMANWAPVLGSGAAMAMRRRFSASGFLPDVRRYGATFFNYVGRALAYVLATPPADADADNPLRLEFGTEASARDMMLFGRRFGCELMESYGSSEGAVVIKKVPGAPAASLGAAPPGMEVAILDPATAAERPRARFDEHGALVNGHEAIGEIVGLNTASAFEGYYNNESADSERLRSGRYWTGDLGYRDADGWFYFGGRGNDWLRVDSENFAAAPIERIMFRFPGVVMAAVYPVPDPRSGDQVMVAIELESGASFDAESFAAFLAEQADLGTKWAPRFVRILTDMPLTASNKVHKSPLRSQRWETQDPVWWRPPDGAAYRAMTAADRAALRRQFEDSGRVSVLVGG